jgi:hypothetical protein
MAGLTRKSARSLLQTVRNKPHASEDDHEELGPPPKKIKTDAVPAKKEGAEKDIYGEPESSDEELGPPPPRPAQSSMAPKPRRNSMEGLALNNPQRTSSRNRPAIRPPARGAYQVGQTLKGRGVEENKEHMEKTLTSSAGPGPIEWGMEYEARRISKNARGYGTKSGNIHAASPKKYGAASKMTYGIAKSSRNKKPPSGSDSELSSIMDDDELRRMFGDGAGVDTTEDPDLPSIPQPRPKRSANETGDFRPTLFDEHELSDTLQPDAIDSLARIAKTSSNSAQTLNQLNKWKEDQEPASSQPQSSAPQDDLDDVSNYVNALPVVEEEGSRCTLCSKLVDQEDYWDFWKGKKKTVKNKTAFCKAHQKTSAQKEYTKAGYPTIDWSALPRRLRKHKTRLSQLLDNTGKRPSIHRNRYEPLALTGKAATVPSRRNDLSEDQQKELNAYALDETTGFPGYYGPHGRRVITENVMEILKTEFKNCKDNVVQASGIAAFVQAVMVPEAAVLMIMEDCGVRWEEAEKIREKTYEMGLLLNEEIEDELERRPEDDSDAENEYHR